MRLFYIQFVLTIYQIEMFYFMQRILIVYILVKKLQRLVFEKNMNENEHVYISDPIINTNFKKSNITHSGSDTLTVSTFLQKSKHELLSYEYGSHYIAVLNQMLLCL